MGLTVMALTMGSLARLTADNAEAIKSRATAARMSEVTDAARAYVTTHYDELLALAGTGSPVVVPVGRSEEHTSELQSLMRTSYAVFCLKKKKCKQYKLS